MASSFNRGIKSGVSESRWGGDARGGESRGQGARQEDGQGHGEEGGEECDHRKRGEEIRHKPVTCLKMFTLPNAKHSSTHQKCLLCFCIIKMYICYKSNK